MNADRKTRILLLEDEETDQLLIRETLADVARFPHEIVHASSLAEGVSRAQDAAFDVVLLDLGLPDSHGLDTFLEFNRWAPELPILVLTGLDDTQISLSALHEGAQDYIVKNNLHPAEFARSIRYAMERHELMTELHRSRNRLRMLMGRLNTTREAERKRISQEFHDVLGQKLSALKMTLTLLDRQLSGESRSSSETTPQDRLDESQHLIDEIITTVQRVAFELRPSTLDRIGLASAVTEEARRFEQRTNISVVLEIESEFDNLDGELSTTLFRAFQELLTNVARHAGANNVNVSFSGAKSGLLMQVQDDGCGIHPDALESDSSIGLLGMQERVAAHGGTIIFKGTPGRGTTVTIAIPQGFD